MLLALDVGNSQIFGGVFEKDRLLFRFRKTSASNATSDEFGVFFKSVLRENKIKPEKILNVAICSVVPDLIYPLHQSSIKYFNIEPFLIGPGIKTGLNIKYKNPNEVGSDRIANAIAGISLFPDKNLIIADFGTATTFCAINRKKEYLGGLIMPGLKISMESLAARTAKLPKIEIAKPAELVAKTTIESIQSGLYYGNLFAVKEILSKIKIDYFDGKDTITLGTGGFSRLFEDSKIFDRIMPDLVLTGINFAFQMNKTAKELAQ
ncbi:MAG: type III pantothenate kinase [Elusimicrobia bacterium]|nr:type III pantothenate kinase [Elusimicrobiota bacterium]